jgi:hypothetical protein
VSTTDMSRGVNGAGSQRLGPKRRGSAERGATGATTEDTVIRPEVAQLPWAPVLLNPRRLASAAIGTARHGTNYTRQLASIVTGGSPIQPAKGDRRFADPTFTDHPVYRRVMQAYLALCSEVDAAVAEAELPWKDKELLHFFAEMVTSTLAPTNLLLRNPAATEAIITQIERFAPGFHDRIVGRTVRTTTQMSTYNPNYVGGDIMTGSKDFRQLAFGPRITLSPYRIGLRGMYICSAATPPGPGAHGMCGANAAETALHELDRH